MEQHPGLLLHDIARLFRRCFSQRLRDLGLSEPQWRVLGTLNKFPGISQTRVAQLLGIGKAPLGKLIDKLEAEGLILRSADQKDRRVKLLRISSAGDPISRELVKRHIQFQRLYLQDLPARRLGALERTLRVVHRNLSQQSGSDLGIRSSQSLTLMHLISVISRLNSRHFNLQLKQMGFTRSQWLVLTAIGRHEGWRQNELAEELHMGKAPLGALIDELEAGNWVQRRVHPQDRRARSLHLTRNCRRQLQNLGDSFENMHTRSLTGVAESERRALSAALTNIRDQLKSIAKGNSDALREEKV